MASFNFPIGTILRVLNIFKSTNQIAQCTHKFQLTQLTGGSSFSSTAFLTQWSAEMLVKLPPILSNSAEYYGSMCYIMNPIGAAPRPDDTGALSQVGTGGAGLLPTQACGLTSWYTPLLGKHGQGRTYWPFPAPAHSEADGTPTAAYLTLLGDLTSFLTNTIAVVDGPVTGLFNHVIYHDPLAGPQFVDDGLERNAWATQRRRGAFGKANSPPF